MAAVAHATPAVVRRLAAVPAGTFPGRLSAPQVGPSYRRRRAVAVLVVATTVAALVLALHGLLVPFGGGPLTASERPGAQGGVYVVQPGDTFWEIARRLEPDQDPRPLVAQLVAAHGSPVLVPGERLRLPG